MPLNKSTVLTLFLVCVASILAVYTALTTQIISLSADDWGLLSRFPVTYWVGLVALSVLILFSLRNSKFLSLKISIVIFVLILVYTNFLPQIVVTPISLSRMSLWPSSQASLTISTGHISIGQPKQLMDYNNWPFFTVFTSIFMLITGSPLSWLLKWFPLFAITLWALLVFIILKRFLEPKYSIIGAALFLCGSWTRNHYFGPQSFAFILFLIILYLLLKTENATFTFNKKSFFILAFIAFISLVFSHVLTPVAILLMLAATYLITNLFDKRSVKQSKSLLRFILLCTTIMAVYTTYITPNFINYAFNKVIDAFGRSFVQQLSRVSASQYQTFTNYSTYGLVFGFISISLIGLFLMLRDNNQSKLSVLTWFSSISIMFIIALIPYGDEGYFRAFIFALPFFSLICVSLLKRKPRILGSLLLIFLILSVPALYGSYSYRLMSDSELAGGEYIAQYLPEPSKVFGRVSTQVRYFNPLINIAFYRIGNDPFLSYDPVDIEQNLHFCEINYMVVNRNEINNAEYYAGTNPYKSMNLPQNVNTTNACFYDNGDFSIYVINLSQPYNQLDDNT